MGSGIPRVSGHGMIDMGLHAGVIKKVEPVLETNNSDSNENLEVKKKIRGTNVSYSGIRTSSQGLLTGAKTEKKTLLGG